MTVQTMAVQAMAVNTMTVLTMTVLKLAIVSGGDSDGVLGLGGDGDGDGGDAGNVGVVTGVTDDDGAGEAVGVDSEGMGSVRSPNRFWGIDFRSPAGLRLALCR
jgi:hypothetical protein